MSVLKDLSFSLFVFHLIGLAPLRFGVADVSLKNKTYLVPVAVSSILNIIIIGFLLSSSYLYSFGKIHTIINIASLLSGLVINLSANFQCWFYSSTYQEFLHRLQKIESVCKEKFSGNLPFSSFANRYRLKVLLILAVLFVSFTLSTIELWYMFDIQGVIASILLTAILSINALIVVHAILYIDLVQMFFRGLNLHIQNSPICFYSSSKIEFLKNVKLLHMDLWKLLMQINEFLSWSLLFITINFLIDLVYDIYFIFHTLQFNWDGLDVTAGLFALLYDFTGLFMLVNSCHCCSLEEEHLIENIERYVFWTNEDIQLFQLKHEILRQIKTFPASITASGFFEISRRHLAAIAAACCTYIIIFIQFFLSVE